MLDYLWVRTWSLSRRLPNLTPRTSSAPIDPSTISSNGLFTPVRRNNADNENFKSKYHTVPRGNDAKHFTGKSTDFGDAKEFILAVPEPLALRPRDAGRPPAVTRHLEKHATATTASPAGSDKLPHPNKLFRAIRKGGDVRSSLCSSSSLRVDHRESDAAAAMAAKEVTDAVDRAIEEGTEQRQYTASSSEDSKTGSVKRGRAHTETEDGMTALHRLRSYRSLTGSRPAPLARAGTITRPKTPVDELRKFYGQDTGDSSAPRLHLPKDLTVSTGLTIIDNSSENDSISTAATSPTLPTGHLQLLPTPLRPQKSAELSNSTRSVANHPDDALFEQAEDQSELPPLQTELGRKRGKRTSRGFYHTGRRSKPAPLTPVNNTQSNSPTGHQPRRSLTEIGTSFSTSLRPNQLRSKMRASSMYSQDTHGFHLVPTPTTPDFPSPIIDIFADHEMCGNPYTTTDSVKARIAEWTKLIGGVSTPKFSPLPQEVTEEARVGHELLGERMTDKTQDAFVENTGGRNSQILSDDVNKQDEEVLGQAPGGALWI